jgi:hypothetical protein
LTYNYKFQTFDSDSAGDQNADSGPTQVGAADGAPSDLSPAAAGPSESTGPAAADEAPADLDAATADLQAPVLRATPDDEPAPDSVPESGPAASGRRPRRLRKPILIAVAAIVAMLAAAGGTLAAMAKTVTISVDGATQQVTTLSGTVGGALSAAGVDVGQHDTLAPAQDAGISDGSNIVIQRGRLFTVTIDGRQRSVWTTATTVEAALAQLGQRASEFDLSADRSRSIPLSGLSVTADTLHTVTLASAPAPSTTGGPGIAVWEQIAQCESTNNWSINTGNGYNGGLQFDIPTWLGNGGGQYAPRADLATKAQQIDIANRVYASRGLSPWQCAYILGLI